MKKLLTILVAVIAIAACAPQSEPGPQGPKGSQGEQGEQGLAAELTITVLTEDECQDLVSGRSAYLDNEKADIYSAAGCLSADKIGRIKDGKEYLIHDGTLILLYDGELVEQIYSN